MSRENVKLRKEHQFIYNPRREQLIDGHTKKLFKVDAVSYKHFHIKHISIGIPIVFSLIFIFKCNNGPDK